MNAVQTTTHALRAMVTAPLSKSLLFERQVAFWLGELRPTWSLTELRARVVAVRDEARDFKTLVLEPNGLWPGHRAGQYVPVELELGGVRVRRYYSLSSAPGERRLALTVKRVPGGRVSGWIHQHVRPGAVLRLGAPAGEFVLPEVTPAKLLLLSGGSGVTPLRAILKDLALRDAVRDVVFLHCARSRHDAPFRRELQQLEARHPGLRVSYRFDDEAGRGARLDEARLRQLVPDLDARDTLLCGPAPMMDSLAPLWARAGLADKLRTERFGPAPAAPRAESDTGAATRVYLARSQRTVTVDGRGSLLEQLERAGVEPASGCRMGICNTCRCHKSEGVVEDMVSGAVSTGGPQELRLCVSRARGPLSLDL